ncbi:hypothetical protein AMJ86_04285 [bacterium SM23_57]|nr:MAG: hypothetical protein AMJ86_04285 [bacterium SM23_57]
MNCQHAFSQMMWNALMTDRFPGLSAARGNDREFKRYLPKSGIGSRKKGKKSLIFNIEFGIF